MSNGNVPCKDGMQRFWLEKPIPLHERIAAQLPKTLNRENGCLNC